MRINFGSLIKDSNNKYRVRRLVIASVGALLILGAALSGLAFKRKFLYVDEGPAVLTLTPETVVTLVDTDEDGQCNTAEQILLEGVKARIRQATEEQCRIYIQVGHIEPDRWLDFESLEQMIRYCQYSHGFHSLQVRKNFWQMDNPIFCMGGWGAYLELDSNLGLRGLWVIHTDQGGWSHLILRYLSFGQYSVYSKEKYDQLTPIADVLLKAFSWKRHSAKELKDRYTPLNAESAMPFGPHKQTIAQMMKNAEMARPKQLNLSERLQAFKEDIPDRQKEVQEEWEGLLRAAGDLKSDRDYYRLAVLIRSGTEYSRFGFSTIEKSIYQKMIEAPDRSVTPPLVEDSLYHLGYHYTRDPKQIKAIECFSRLREEFPESKYLPSALLCEGDAYRALAVSALGISSSAAEDYFRLSYSCLNKVLQSSQDPGTFIGTSLNFAGGGSRLKDHMVGQSTQQVAEELQRGLLKDVQWDKEGDFSQHE